MGSKVRRAHEIGPIKRFGHPERLIVFDTEASIEGMGHGVERHRVKLIVYRYMALDKDDPHKVIADEYGHTDNTDDFITLIEKRAVKNQALNLYAHNLGYDLQITSLVRALIDRGWEIRRYITDNPPTLITLRRGKHAINIIDTFNYFQASIKKIGQSLGLVKGEIDYYAETDQRAWLAYAYRDVEILSEYLYRFILFLHDHDLAPLAPTIAGQAFRSYRYRFMPGPIPLHRDAEALSVERQGYMGGRVECFRLGCFEGVTIYKLDINSMYPYVMSSYEYPIIYLGQRSGLDRSKLVDLMAKYYVIADVEVSINVPLIPVRHGVKLIFPIGQFRAVIHHAELDRVMRYGSVIRVYRVFVYKRGDLFSQYVEFFYRIKQDADRNGDQVRRQMAKMFLNSLYGKFGERGHVDIYEEAQGSDDGHERIRGYSERLGREVMITRLGGKTITTLVDGEGFYSYPAIAGAVTSYARAYLADLILTAGLDHVYYVDTDSLFVDADGLYNLRNYLSQSDLGLLKIEGKTDRLILYGPKDYVFGDEVKLKGVPKSAQALGDNRYQYKQFRGLKEWERSGMPAEVIVTDRVKTLSRRYDKGRVEGDRVYPWVLCPGAGG